MRHGKGRFVAGFLALPLALYVWYVVWPFAQAFGYSFTDWGGYSDEQHLVGFANYVRLFNDELIGLAFWHNVFFLITVPLITITLALFFAFLLNVGGRGNRAGIRGDDQGLLNGLLIKSGLVDKAHPLGFVADPTPFLGVPAVLWWILFIAVWGGVGFYLVLFSAAMQSIPRDLFEAALLDGAGRFSQFFRVSLPLLRDTVSIAWVYLGFIALDMYALVFVMTPSQGGPNHASEIFASVLNFTAFNSSRSGRYGYACAMGVALAIFTIILAALQLRLTRRERIEF
jgi:N-acetylglucosamine transport system permease protein